jgi:hypothetical protein
MADTSIYLSSNDPQPTSNTITQFLDTVLRVEQNALQILTTLSDIVAGNSQTVIVSVENTDGTTSNYELPSIGFLKTEIARIDKNFNILTGMNGGETIVRMPDGSYKKILEARLFKEPKPIGSLEVPAKFYKRPNWFFESFLNPLLFVNIDITKYVDFDLQQAFVKRVIINASSDTAKNYFDTNYKGRNDIDHDTFLKDLVTQGIGYFLDEDTVSLPSTLVRYSGTFRVLNIEDVSVQTLNNQNQTVVSTVRQYTFDTLSYTDNLLTTQNSKTLAVGDRLDLDDLTQLEVIFIDAATNKVRLKRLSGTNELGIGSSLIISPIPFTLKVLQVNVGYDEREVIFIKPIDKNFNVTTRNFSPGFAFYTNDLTIDTVEGTIPFENYYKTQVTDFGNAILSLAKEKPIPAVYSVKPDAPLLDAANFKVVLVNSQKMDTSVMDEIKKKTAQKNSVYSEVNQLDIAIEKKKQELNTSKFNSDAERNAVKNQLDDLVREKTAKSNLYASLVKDLSTLAQNPPSELDSPKYRVRGFWPIPAPKPSEKTTLQNVVQFVIQYRYLSLDGNAPGTEQYDFVDNSGATVRAYFSNWNEVKSELRKKKYDPTVGSYVWASENLQDAEEVNINQLDIPISKGEKVEIRIKSISEAGWPVNPQVSDWSSSITVNFPAELEQEAEVSTSLKEADAEQIRVNFNQDLAARGLDIHLSNSFVQKDKYYAHTAESISSGFFNADGSIIDLYTKIKQLEDNYNTLKALIEKAKGVLKVTVVDTSGNVYNVSNNSVVSLFSGYYQERVSALPTSEQKGAILTDVYKIVLENAAASPLQLVSSYPGGLDVNLEVSNPGATGNTDYNKSRRYDIVPISLSSLRSTAVTNADKYQASPFQSSQILSQYIYERATDIGLSNYLIDTTYSGSGTLANSYEPNFGTATDTPAAFIWNGGYSGTAPQGNGFLTSFAIHTDHPAINDGTSPSITTLNRPGATGSTAAYPVFRHAYAFERDSSANNYYMQAPFELTNVPSATTGNRYPIKLGFYNNDRYLVGANTCGSYLYLAPTTYSDLLVDGTDYKAVRTVDFGDAYKIEIPVIFQFRMTDYYGAGNAGTGRIGGSANAVNLTYIKKIGIDITAKDESFFSFDIQVTGKYKVDTPSQATTKPVQNFVPLAPRFREYSSKFRLLTEL